MEKRIKQIDDVWLGLITAVLLGLLSVFLFCGAESGIPLTVRVESDGVTEEIYPWYDDRGTWYFFLPSYAELDRTVLCVHGTKCRLDGKRLTAEQTLDFAETEKEYGFEQHNVRTNVSTRVVFMKSANVAAMYVDTQTGDMDAVYEDRNCKVSALVKVVDEAGRLNYSGDFRDEIKGRGNSTWSLDKKPFSLKLSEEASLLGMADARNWVLLANGYDETNLRNKLICDYAAGVMTEWTPHCEYVDLYLNGEYNGLYLLSEKIEVSDARLKLGDRNRDFLFESIQPVKIKQDDKILSVGENQNFVLNYPSECDESTVSAIQEDVARLNKEILDGDLSEIDLDSWVRRFLIDEIFINHDAIQASSYYYYDTASGKYYAGPIWDYDLSFGNDASLWTERSREPDQIYTIRRYWYSDLYQNDVFYERIKQIYREDYRPALETMLAEELPELTERIAGAGRCNSIRWDALFKETYAEDAEPEERNQALTRFLRERLSYLASVWCTDKEFEIVRWYAADQSTLLDVTLVEHGTAVTELPSPNGETASDWYDMRSGAVLDTEQPVMSGVNVYSGVAEEYAAVDEASPDRKAALVKRLSAHKSVLYQCGLCAVIGCVMLVWLYADIRYSHKKERGKQ